MAAADIVFEDTEGAIFVLLCDAVMSETHRAGALATEDEVEEGVDITDHYREERVPLDLVVSISDTTFGPIPAPEGDVTVFPVRGAVEGVDIETASGRVTAQVWTPEADPITRTADSWGLIQRAVRSSEDGRPWRATITTRTATYESMLLTRAEAPRTKEKGTIMDVALTFMPLRTVSTARVEVGAEPVRPRNRAGTDEGPQASTELTEEQRTSLGAQGVDSVASFLGLGG